MLLFGLQQGKHCRHCCCIGNEIRELAVAPLGLIKSALICRQHKISEVL
ncbi:MAG: hypothetical protein ACLSCV_04345 [Acutalibacteraceae bacterium]